MTTIGTLRVSPGAESLLDDLESLTNLMFVGIGDRTYYVYARMDG